MSSTLACATRRGGPASASLKSFAALSMPVSSRVSLIAASTAVSASSPPPATHCQNPASARRSAQ